MSKRLTTLLFIGALSGCATTGLKKPGGQSQSFIPHVPFYANNTDQCGPAALASVITFWGQDVTPEQLKNEVYVSKIGGTLPMDMGPALRSHHLSAQPVSGNFELIKEEIRAERPVIAYLNFGTKSHPIGHYVVITGYDDAMKVLIIHSGTHPNKFASYKRFDRGWKDTDHWMLLVSTNSVAESLPAVLVPPQEKLSADDHVRLGLTYEAQNLTADAADQYRRALSVDKTYVPAYVALGNQAFNQKDYPAAEKYFKRALKCQPDHPGANNNLAMTYLMEGKNLHKARELAKTAAASPDYKIYAEDTLAQIGASER